MAKYIVSVKIDTETEIFEFSNKVDREMFIRGMEKMNSQVEYTLSEELETDPDPMIDEEEEEEPWRTEASSHISIQLVNEFDVPEYFTPYEMLQCRLTPSLPVLIYKVAGALVFTQERSPEGEITQEELEEWTSTLKPLDKASESLNNKVISNSFDLNRLRPRTKSIPKP